MRRAEYEQAFMFAYSMRERTHAWHRLEDDVPEEVKKRRLAEVVQTFRETALARSARLDTGQVKLVLAEKPSRRSTVENPQLTGRTDTHKRTVFGETAYADWGEFLKSCSNQGGNEITLQRGDFVAVKISNAAVTTLKAEALFRTSIQEFTRLKESGDLDKIATTT
jgi:tRNA A37 methylthiotransferase MiaB